MGGIAGGGLSLGTLFINIAANVDQATAALQKFGSDTSTAIDKQKEKWAGMKDIGQSMTQLGGTLTAALTLPIVGIGAAAVKVAEDLNKAKVSFTTMLGSAEDADKMLKELQQFAAKTPFEFPDLVEAARRMKALGVETNQVIPWLKTIGDTAAAMGGGKDVIDGITLALSQMTAKGKVSAEEMNQLAERGVPAWKILADQIGVSVPEAMKLAEKGAIKAAEAVPAILDGMNQKFGGSMDQMSKTLSGQWSNFKDQITLALIPIGQALIPALQSLLVAVTPLLAAFGDFAQFFADMPQPIQTFIIILGGIVAAIGPILIAAGSLLTAIAAIGPVLAGLGITITVSVGAILGWAVAIAAAVAALVALGVWVYNNWDTIVGGLTKAWDGIKDAWSAVWATITGALKAVWDGFKATIVPYWQFIIDLVSAIWNVIFAVWEAEWKLIVGVVKAVWDTIGPYVRKVLDPVVKFVKELWDGIKRYWDAIWTAIDVVVRAAWNAIAKEAKSVFTPAVKLLGAVWDALKAAWKRVWDGIEDTLTAIWNRMAGAATKAWEAIAKIGSIVTGIPAKLNTLATSIRNVGNEADKAAGHSPVPELAEALEDVNTASTPTPGLIDDAAESIRGLGSAADTVEDSLYDLGTAASAAHAQLDFAPGFAAIQAGATATATAFDDLGTAAGAAKGSVNTAAGDMAREVSTIMTNLAQDISKSLWEGDGSWSEKGLNALKSLGQAVTSQFITPFTTAISNFISGALSDLLGKTGLGGVLDSIKNIGKESADVFGGGADKVPGTSTPTPGGGAGTAVTNSLTGWISAISGAVTAISSVVGNFQMAGMNKSLDLIVNHTLRTFNELFNLRGDAWDRWTQFMQIKDDLIRPLNSIMDNAARIAVASERTININVTGSDPATLSSMLATRLRLQGAFA